MTEKDEKKSIRRSIILIVTAIFLVIAAFVAVGYYAVSTYLSAKQADKTMTEDLMKQSEQTVNLVSQSITNSAEKMEKSLYVISKSEELQKLLNEDKDETRESLLKIFENYKNTHPEVESIYLGMADKKMHLFPKFELPKEYDPTTRSWYINALNKMDFTWSEPYVDAITGNAIISLSLPVYNEDETMGVLSIDLNLSAMVEEIKDIKLGAAGYMIITDQNGIMIVHPDKNQRGIQLPIENLSDLTAKGDTGIVWYSYQGVKETAIYSKINKLNLNLIGFIKE